MRQMLIAAAFGVAAACLTQPAQAFWTTQMQVAAAADAQSNVVEAKYKHRYKGRPPGWSRGKAWWKRGGRGVPPGHRR